MRQLTDRLMRLKTQETGVEPRAEAGAIAPSNLEAPDLSDDELEETEIDPLLDRLAPLLEDF